MFKSTLVLFLAVSLPFSSAVPTENVVPPSVSLGSSKNITSDELITPDGITQDPAVYLTLYGTTSCSGGYLTDTYPDATCVTIYNTDSLDIWDFYGDCRFVRVFSGSNCDGVYADLGIVDKCWYLESVAESGYVVGHYM
ncbi:hypothetical protein OIDMADRAFT_25912 [Oidiodendron maius Zn]|uniref:Uncharacterized protein n=1 Tax=Oidiodendron maius (strain Zn) TaxID=913774 RepID=A0A0C3HAS6_OIDMZ|nr:hypothetical protein OIDMADRAFT_25912 [Oidiodendron maius Zn]